MRSYFENYRLLFPVVNDLIVSIIYILSIRQPYNLQTQ